MTYEEAISAEVERWPGVTVAFEDGGKHPRAVLTFGDQSRFVVYPASPSDSRRGVLNCLTGVRRELDGIGAERLPEPKSATPKRERNPGADEREIIAHEPAPVIPDPWEALRGRPLITQPGAYTHIEAEDYHGNANLLPGPSLSSTGAKTILRQSPYHFWFNSPMNPNPVAEESKPTLNVGKAAHDRILLGHRWPEYYHVTPEGFSLGATKKFADEIAEYEQAVSLGKTILREQDLEVVNRAVDSLRANPLAMRVLSNGVPEVTLAWQDHATGVWLRARPDFLPNAFVNGGKVLILPDLKFMAPTHCSPDGFSKAISSFGYHMSLAFYADGLKAVYGRAPTNFLLIAVEKEAPWSVSLYEVPAEDIERGRFQNRQAINKFAECLHLDQWPSYADAPVQVGLPHWDRKRIDDGMMPPDASEFDEAA